MISFWLNSQLSEVPYRAAGGRLVCALACDLECDIVGGIALELEVCLGQVVEVLVEQLGEC